MIHINIDKLPTVHERSYIAGRISEKDIFLVIFITPVRKLHAVETMPARHPSNNHAGASQAI
jgi:hypothetical protein